MSQTALIVPVSNNKLAITFIEEIKEKISKKKEIVGGWDISLIPVPKKRFELSYKNQKLFNEILNSKEGRHIVNKLKNEKSNKIINIFMEDMKQGVGPGTLKESGEKKYSLRKFFDEAIAQPLSGRKLKGSHDISLTKQEIWNAFIEYGLIVKI